MEYKWKKLNQNGKDQAHLTLQHVINYKAENTGFTKDHELPEIPILIYNYNTTSFIQ